jgi:mono/diheme cytochrome c family protein
MAFFAWLERALKSAQQTGLEENMRAFLGCLLLGALLIPVVAVIAFLLGWFPIAATSDPPCWETFLARRAFAASVARQAKLENPIQPSSSNVRLGLKIYRDNCSGCHGDTGKPSQWGTAGFYPRVPQFDSEVPLKPDWQMFWVVKHGIRYTGMGAWEGMMPTMTSGRSWAF